MKRVYLHDRMWSVQYGLWLLGPYANAIHGSVVLKSFIGPWALHRAIRWTTKQRNRRKADHTC